MKFKRVTIGRGKNNRRIRIKVPINKKLCRKCNVIKLRTEFYSNGIGLLCPLCKICRVAQTSKYAIAKRRARRHYRTPKRRASKNSWARMNPERIAEYRKRLKEKYPDYHKKRYAAMRKRLLEERVNAQKSLTEADIE